MKPWKSSVPNRSHHVSLGQGLCDPHSSQRWPGEGKVPERRSPQQARREKRAPKSGRLQLSSRLLCLPVPRESGGTYFPGGPEAISQKRSITFLGTAFLVKPSRVGKAPSRCRADPWEAELGDSRRQNTLAAMGLQVSKLKTQKGLNRKAPNSFTNKSFPPKVLRNQACFEGGWGWRREEEDQEGTWGFPAVVGEWGAWNGS